MRCGVNTKLSPEARALLDELDDRDEIAVEEVSEEPQAKSRQPWSKRDTTRAFQEIPPDAESLRRDGVVVRVDRGFRGRFLGFTVDDLEWRAFGARIGTKLEIETSGRTTIAARLTDRGIVLRAPIPAGVKHVRIRRLS